MEITLHSAQEKNSHGTDLPVCAADVKDWQTIRTMFGIADMVQGERLWALGGLKKYALCMNGKKHRQNSAPGKKEAATRMQITAFLSVNKGAEDSEDQREAPVCCFRTSCKAWKQTLLVEKRKLFFLSNCENIFFNL